DQIECAFIFGSVAKGNEKSTSDIDLMIVGSVTMAELLPALTRAERQTGRAVNPTIYPPEELAEKYRLGNHFVRTVLAESEKPYLISSGDDLAKAAIRRAHKTAQNKSRRNRRIAPRRRSQT